MKFIIRILLLTFVIVTTVATCVVLTSSPHGPWVINQELKFAWIIIKC